MFGLKVVAVVTEPIEAFCQVVAEKRRAEQVFGRMIAMGCGGFLSQGVHCPVHCEKLAT